MINYPAEYPDPVFFLLNYPIAGQKSICGPALVKTQAWLFLLDLSTTTGTAARPREVFYRMSGELAGMDPTVFLQYMSLKGGF